MTDERRLPGPPPATASQPIRYVGLLTRGIAFAIDAAIINLVSTIVGIGAALILSILHLPKDLHTALGVIGGVAYVLWCIGYFVGFWWTTGQTIGARVMRFRVVAVRGEHLKPRRALVRCIGLLLAALPLFAGYLMIPFNRRRRGLQDYLARTVVIDAPGLSIAGKRRAARKLASTDSELAAGSSNSGDDRPVLLPQTSA